MYHLLPTFDDLLFLSKMETKPVANGPIQLQAPRVESKGNVVDTSFLPVALTEEQKVLRKIDRTVLPMMCAVFFLQYLDKQSLSYAGVFGVIEDLELTPQQFSWASSIFYVGQLISEYPFIYLMSKLPVTKLVGSTV